MSDERRERYAAAMAAAYDAGPEWAYEWYPEADAAMSVADEEVSARAASVQSYWECEAKRWQGRAADAEQKVIDMGGYRVAAEALGADNARLRAELYYAQLKREDNWAEVVRTSATIERVRAVLTELNSRADAWSEAAQEVLSGVEYGWAADLLHDALNAPTTVANPNRTKVDE
ncbi:hypothetical protein [Streptomyces asiaticus]|uniref:hypothetical protein n=1 Tax=Streptomyces asiaticus TaxID=114695 RepID=UPI001BA66CAB|nr:hypothetical protein [Streptomyces asiaticus]